MTVLLLWEGSGSRGVREFHSGMIGFPQQSLITMEVRKRVWTSSCRCLAFFRVSAKRQFSIALSFTAGKESLNWEASGQRAQMGDWCQSPVWCFWGIQSLSHRYCPAIRKVTENTAGWPRSTTLRTLGVKCNFRTQPRAWAPSFHINKVSGISRW